MSADDFRLLVASEVGLVRLGEREGMLHDGPFFALAAGPGGEVWASSGRQLVRGDRLGARAVAELADDITSVTVFHRTPYVGIEGPSLWRFTDRLEELPAFARTEGHEEWHQPFPAPPQVRSFAASEGALYINVHVGGVLVSTDGEHFAPSGFDLHDDAHEVRVDRGRIFVAAAGGLWSSGDGGKSFRRDREGLRVSYLRACAVSEHFVFVSAATGPFARQSGVHRRPLEGGRFERVANGVPPEFVGIVDTHCVDAQGRRVAIGTANGEVYYSEDEGESFTRLASGLAEVRAVRFLPAASA